MKENERKWKKMKENERKWKKEGPMGLPQRRPKKMICGIRALKGNREAIMQKKKGFWAPEKKKN